MSQSKRALKRFRRENRQNKGVSAEAKRDGPIIVTMKRVITEVDKRGKWMRWEWDGKQHNQPIACGFSGIIMDGAREMEYHIEMEELNVAA